jgi:PadR family transcriptional regulator, regulatory protein AphA
MEQRQRKGKEPALSPTAYAVLGLLTRGEASGYDLSKLVERSVGFIWRPAKSQIYVVLSRLVDDGYARRREVAQSHRPDKQMYRITRKGERALRDWLESADLGAEASQNPFLLKIFFGDHVSTDVLASQLRDYRARLQERLDRYREIEREIAGEDEDFFPYLTLKHGLLRLRAGIRWADETLRELEQRGSDEPS